MIIIVGFSVVLCVFFLLAAFREGHRIREIDMNKHYQPDRWSIFETLKIKEKLRKGLHYYYITK